MVKLASLLQRLQEYSVAPSIPSRKCFGLLKNKEQQDFIQAGGVEGDKEAINQPET